VKAARALVFVAALLLAAAKASAHQLDELVQSAKLDIARDRVIVELTLLPGVQVVPQLLSAADRNADLRISPEEVHQYGSEVLRSLTLAVDGRRLTLALKSAEASAAEELADGMGVIRLRAEAAVPPLADGRHQILFRNAHTAAASVYLANALVPSDRAIDIRAQRRDRLQQSLELDIDVAAPRLNHAGAGLLVATFFALVGVRGRRLWKP
jgi:hypothetical protein